jgi:hypothetical protein
MIMHPGNMIVLPRQYPVCRAAFPRRSVAENRFIVGSGSAGNSMAGADKLEVDQSDGVGIVRFPAATATMAADSEELKLTLEAEDEATLERML